MKLITLLLFAFAVSAETVYLTEGTRTFHKTTTCTALAKATTVYQIDREKLAVTATSPTRIEPRKPCQRCYKAKALKVPEGATPVAKSGGSR